MPTGTDYADWEEQGKIGLPKEECEHCGHLVHQTTPCTYIDDGYQTEVWCCDSCIEDSDKLLNEVQ